jgi:hypothetical protein
MSEAKKYISLHVPKTAGTTIVSMLPEQRPHNGPFAEVYHPGEYPFRPKETWSRLHKHTGKVIKEAGQELADIIEEKQYCRKLDHYTLEQRFETGLIPEEEFDNYFSFCFVRNPWDRLVSIHAAQNNKDAYRRNELNLGLTEEQYLERVMGIDAFSGFLELVLSQLKNSTPKWYYKKITGIYAFGRKLEFSFGNHLVPQNLYAFDKTRNKKVSFIGRYENLENDFKVVVNELGLEKDIVLPHLNSQNSRRKGRHYTEFYTKETRDLIAEIYAEDIKMFGYKFGEQR